MNTFGEVSIDERVYIKAGRLVRPFSPRAGVKCRGYSGVLQRRITDFGAEKSFAKAAQQIPVMGGGAPQLRLQSDGGCGVAGAGADERTAQKTAHRAKIAAALDEFQRGQCRAQGG